MDAYGVACGISQNAKRAISISGGMKVWTADRRLFSRLSRFLFVRKHAKVLLSHG